MNQREEDVRFAERYLQQSVEIFRRAGEKEMARVAAELAANVRMSAVTRKVLIVKRDDGGWNVMLELNDRTRSLQIDDATGEEIVAAVQDVIVGMYVQRGLGNLTKEHLTIRRKA